MAASLSPHARAGNSAVPAVREPQAERDPNLRDHADSPDLQGAIGTLYHYITDPTTPESGVGGIDLFITRLAHNLRKGNDVPRDRILQNSLAVRETLRLSFNDLLTADSPPLLPQARDIVKEVSSSLGPLLKRNRESVQIEEEVADSARATASAMAIRPPDSPGDEVPVERLCAIRSIEPELKALQKKLGQAAKSVQKAKSLIQLAKDRSALLDKLAEKAGKLDEQAFKNLENGGTNVQPKGSKPKVVPIRSKQVTETSNAWLKECIKTAEAVVEAFDTQLDPRKEGIAKAVALSLDADKKTMNARVIGEQSGQRINFNHFLRMSQDEDAAIPAGWHIASPKRKPWWEGRAGLAKSSSLEDAGKMRAAHEKAEKGAAEAEGALQAGLSSLERLDQGLGPDRPELSPIDEREVSVPKPRDTPAKSASRVEVRSKGLKVPHVTNVPQGEVEGAFDGEGAAP